MPLTFSKAALSPAANAHGNFSFNATTSKRSSIFFSAPYFGVFSFRNRYKSHPAFFDNNLTNPLPKTKTETSRLLFIRLLLSFSLYIVPTNPRTQQIPDLPSPQYYTARGIYNPVGGSRSESSKSVPESARMAYQQVALELARDGPCTPWGFRMTGGADIGAPLVIQKVIFGSPSEGELHKGDIIVKVRDKDASRLSHQVATDLITKAGSTLKLVVARSLGGHIARGIAVPGVTAGMTAPPMFDGQNNLFRPLPTTNFGNQRQRRCSAESFTSTTSSDTEKDLIINQPYRSTPLILPAAKASKDIPVGSYLRYDSLTKRTGTPPNVGSRDPYMHSRVHEAILEAAQTSSGCSSPQRTPTPDIGLQNGPQVSIKQYNTPINMYSNQAIVEALAAQTVSTRNPQMEHAEVLEAKKMSNITQSPTYQLIHEEEWKRGKVQEYKPLTEHVYNVIPQGTGDKLEIHQSGSFKSIMHDLRGFSDF